MLDVKDRIGIFPTYLQFAQGVRDAMNQYLTLNRPSIEKALWKLIPLGFGAQLKNQNGKLEVAVVVKFYKQLEELPQLFATALYSMMDLSAASGTRTFRLQGHDCTPQQDDLLIIAAPILVMDPGAEIARDYGKDNDSTAFQAMTNNVIYLFQGGGDAECGNGAVPPNGFNPPGTPATTRASAR
jgi:hypothetical protein